MTLVRTNIKSSESKWLYKLSKPAESLSITLLLEDGAHKHLQRLIWAWLSPRQLALACGSPLQSKYCLHLLFRNSSRHVNLVTQDQHRSGF